MSNELTDVRCPCGAEFQADSYDAGFIAGSGMCQNCDAALPPKDICTCPSGDGSLRHPCPAHPAVDQADVAAKLTFINGRPAMCGCQVEYSDGGGEYSDVIYVTLCAKHSGSAILDLVATNRIALTPEYEGQWHADLYLDREIPLAKVEGATPAEAVLALMSAERIDPEQESVEQASGDERAAFEAAASKLGIYTCNFQRYTEETAAHENRINARVEDPVRVGDYRSATLHDCWKIWQEARAALAQPSPAPTTSGYDQLWGWFGLSRSAYAVLPRVMMHAMPDDWQARFAELMDEWDDHWPNQPDITAHVQIKQNNRFISTPPWLLNYRHPDHNQLNAMRGKDEL